MCGARYLLASASAGAGAQLGAPSGLPASSCPGGAIHIGEQAGDHHHGDGAIHNQHHIGTWSNIITQVLLWTLSVLRSTWVMMSYGQCVSLC